MMSSPSSKNTSEMPIRNTECPVCLESLNNDEFIVCGECKHTCCNKCVYKATTKVDLLHHIKSIHEGVKFPCNQCDYQATLQQSLNRHIESKHELDRSSGTFFLCGGSLRPVVIRHGLAAHHLPLA